MNKGKMLIADSSPCIAANPMLTVSAVGSEDFSTVNENDPATKMLLKLPIVFDWIEFKGETVFMGINYEATQKAKKPMVDIFYCATQALNNNVLFTTQWDKSKFKPSHLGQQF